MDLDDEELQATREMNGTDKKVMSEEEILAKIEQFIDDYRQYDTRTEETIIPYKYGEGQRYVYKETYYAIQGLLDLYNKEKEKNKEYEEILEISSKALDNIAYDQIPIAIKELLGE